MHILIFYIRGILQMIKSIRGVLTAAFLASATVPACASAVQYGANFFEYVSDQGISWNDAATASNELIYDGHHGYLAVITSAGENNFLANTVAPSGFSDFAGSWIGGKVFGSGSGTGPSGDGFWEQGPLAGEQFSVGQAPYMNRYSNWAGIEPNNAPSAAYMNIGVSYAGISHGEWADAAGGAARPSDPIQGYFVEFSPVPLPASAPMFGAALLVLGAVGYGLKRTKAAAAA